MNKKLVAPIEHIQMNTLSKYLTLVLSFIIFSGCANSLKQDASSTSKQHPSNKASARESIEELNLQTRQRILRMTNTFMAKLGDSVEDKEKEELARIVRGYFAALSHWDNGKFLARLEADEIRNSTSRGDDWRRNTAEELAVKTYGRAQKILDEPGFVQFKCTMISYTQRLTASTTLDTPDAILNQMGSNPDPLNIGGRSY